MTENPDLRQGLRKLAKIESLLLEAVKKFGARNPERVASRYDGRGRLTLDIQINRAEVDIGNTVAMAAVLLNSDAFGRRKEKVALGVALEGISIVSLRGRICYRFVLSSISLSPTRAA